MMRRKSTPESVTTTKSKWDDATIDSKTVIAHEPATMDRGVLAGKITRTVVRMLMSDESVLFGCDFPKTTDCLFTADTVHSIIAHQRAHGVSGVKKALRETAAELEQMKAKKEQEFQNRSNGMKAAADRRRAARAAESTTVTATTTTELVETAITEIDPVPFAPSPAEIGRTDQKNHKKIVGDEKLADAARRVIIAFNNMQQSADEFQKVLIGYLRMAQTKTEEKSAPPIDPEILEKARRFDALRGLISE